MFDFTLRRSPIGEDLDGYVTAFCRFVFYIDIRLISLFCGQPTDSQSRVVSLLEGSCQGIGTQILYLEYTHKYLYVPVHVVV